MKEPGRYCIRLSRVLTSAVSWLMSRLARLARVLVRIVQQPGRVRLGESLALVIAGPAAVVHPVDQPRLAGPA